MRYAIIEYGFVTNVAIADGPIGENWIESDIAGVGWGYVDGEFIEPLHTLPEIPKERPWTKKEFLLKFTPQEYAAIKAAASANAEIDYYWTLFTVADAIDKTDPVTIAGIQFLEAIGLLAPGRAAEILS